MHVAALAKLKLSPDELGKFSRELSQIIDYVDRLAAVDTRGVVVGAEPLATGTYRADTVCDSLPVEEALRNAPEKKDTFFVVPRVM